MGQETLLSSPLSKVSDMYIYFDFESMFIKAGGSETRKNLGQKKQRERAQVGLLWLTRKSEKGGLGDGLRGLARDKLPPPIAPLVASLVWTLRV